MSRFLFATMPAVGHTVPALSIAEALIRRGHSVRWYTGLAFADAVLATGAEYCPMSDADYSLTGLDGYYPERTRLKGMRKLQFDMVHGFAGPVDTQVRDLSALLDAEPADVVVGDAGLIGGPIVHELGGPPFAAFGISVVGFPSRDLAPFGMGLGPTRGPVGRARNVLLDRLMRRVVFRPMTTRVNATRRDLGLSPTAQTVFEYPLAAQLYLQLSAESFEYPRSDLPSQVRFVGPPRPAGGPWSPPAWWGELGDDRSVVLVNQGTVATDPNQLIRPALAGLAGEDVLVVAVTGGDDPAVLGPLPANVRAERHIPFDRLMPHVNVFVTNGGFGGVQLALATGVPIVAAGKTEDKIEVNARVAFAGVGLDLRTVTPQPDQVRAAVSRVLAEPSFTRRAQEMQVEIARAGREEAAATLLEELALFGPSTVPGDAGRAVRR